MDRSFSVVVVCLMVRRAVIPAAGLGTRLFPATIEQPKEMLPIFAKGRDGKIYVKPILQLAFEQLFDSGIREFCFITGKAKRAIEDHFTQDHQVISLLKAKNRSECASEIERFFKMIDESTIVWVSQPGPRGFGDAVYRARPFVKDEDFFVYAGDTYISTSRGSILERILKVQDEFRAEATFLVDEVENPRPYGVIEGEPACEGVYRVKRIVEKPQIPPSNLAVVAVYLFNPIIFKALEKVSADNGGEIQLTDAIQMLVSWGFGVYAVKLLPGELRVDVGEPASYWEALRLSYERSKA
ncbi:MAG: sugar phosphate nucleotidyltransferase [Candidatus Bathyarchaeia archaeon]